MSARETQRAIEAIYRIESPRLIASLTRMVRDVGVAEDLAHDAPVVALDAIYGSSRERTAALDGWLWHYNHRRRHSAIGRQPPISRLNNLLGTYI